jgi:hypothetical protein
MFSGFFSHQPHISELITGYLGIYSGVARLVCKEWAKNIPSEQPGHPDLKCIFWEAAKDGRNELMEKCYDEWGLKKICKKISASGNQDPIENGNFVFEVAAYESARHGHMHTFKLCEKLWSTCTYEAAVGAALGGHTEIIRYCFELRRNAKVDRRDRCVDEQNLYNISFAMMCSKKRTKIRCEKWAICEDRAMRYAAELGEKDLMVFCHNVLEADNIDETLCTACFYQNPECARICHEEWGGSDTIYNTYLEEQREYWSANHQDKNVNDFFLV